MSEIKNNPEQNEVSTFEIDALVATTYNEIAKWHNDQPDQAGLKQLSLELVETIAKATLSHIGLNGNLSIYMDDETKKKVDAIKEAEGKK